MWIAEYDGLEGQNDRMFQHLKSIQTQIKRQSIGSLKSNEFYREESDLHDSCFFFCRDFQNAGSSMKKLLQQTFRKKDPGNDIFCLTKPLFCDRITHVDEHEACRNGEVA